MIVKMARVVAIGPKEDLMDFLALIRQRGILHIDDRPPDKVNGEDIKSRLKTLHLNRKVFSRRIFFVFYCIEPEIAGKYMLTSRWGMSTCRYKP